MTDAMTPSDAAAWVLYMRQGRRAREEYATSPLTNRAVRGPCIRAGCERTAYTQRGVCRHCLAEENHDA